MGTLAQNLQSILDSKEAIRTAINNKGVVVSTDDTLASYATSIDAITGGGETPVVPEWQPHPDWIDISQVNDNEINLLVTEGSGIGFTVKVGTGTGIFSIDWGDGGISYTIGETTYLYITLNESTGLSPTFYLYINSILDDVLIDFGDGTIVHNGSAGLFSISHTYSEYGSYIVEFTEPNATLGWNSDPLNHSVLEGNYKQAITRCIVGTGIDISEQTFSECTNIIINSIDADLVGNGTTVFQHQHTVNGTPCSQGYNTWKIRIYDASGDITIFKIARHNYSLMTQYSPILWAVLGTQHITSARNMFFVTTGTNGLTCNMLQSCSISSFQDCTSASEMFNFCTSLANVILPTSWGNITTCANMFQTCNFTTIILPTSWGIVANCTYMFSNCTLLANLTIPTSWGSVTNCSSMFYSCTSLANISLPMSWGSVTNCSSMLSSCKSLANISLPMSWGSMINCSSMFSYCSFSKIILPTSWGSVTSCSSIFFNCDSLSNIVLPLTWGIISDCNRMFAICSSLQSIILPVSWGSVFDASWMFGNCFSLSKLTLPTQMSSVLTNCSSFLYYCHSLIFVGNLEYLGTIGTNGCNFATLFSNCLSLRQPIVIGSKISAIDISGIVNYPLLITSIRFTNVSSTFAGSSPQVNVSYTSLNATALNLLFGDLPTRVGKIIKVTGCPGAATCDISIATAKGWSVTIV